MESYEQVDHSLHTNDIVGNITNLEELTCFICLGIAYKPVYMKCCSHLICFRCLQSVLKNNIKCPLCKVDISFDKPDKILVRLFDNLTFTCPLKDKGCKKQIKYNFYFGHIISECEYKNQDEHYKSLDYCKKCDEMYKKGNDHICNYMGQVLEMNQLTKKLYQQVNNTTIDINEPR